MKSSRKVASRDRKDLGHVLTIMGRVHWDSQAKVRLVSQTPKNRVLVSSVGVFLRSTQGRLLITGCLGSRVRNLLTFAYVALWLLSRACSCMRGLVSG